MATIKATERFIASPPPQNIPRQLQEWLREEIERLSLAVNATLEAIDLVRARPVMVLAGDADDFNLDTTPKKFANYELFGAIGRVPIEPDGVTGEITLPLPGAYRLTAYFYGLQPSQVQNESIQMLIGVNGVLKVVAGLDVTSNQTQDRSMLTNLTRVFSAGDVITMWAQATGDMGNFEIQETSLEMVFVKLNDDPANLDLNWVP